MASLLALRGCRIVCCALAVAASASLSSCGFIAGKVEQMAGKSVVAEFAKFIQSRYVGIRGFSPQNIWRMKQFYEMYAGNEKLSTLLREISWSKRMTHWTTTTEEKQPQ